jgi:excinuclease UvrABC nuclease subunit
MHAAARDLDFEKAAGLRDRVKALRSLQVFEL